MVDKAAIKRAKHAAWKREYHKRPEVKVKRKARAAVQLAVRRGDLPPIGSQQCEQCSQKAVNYHHDSYLPEHWLAVRPLCDKCHRAWHREDKRKRQPWQQMRLAI